MGDVRTGNDLCCCVGLLLVTAARRWGWGVISTCKGAVKHLPCVCLVGVGYWCVPLTVEWPGGGGSLCNPRSVEKRTCGCPPALAQHAACHDDTDCVVAAGRRAGMGSFAKKPVLHDVSFNSCMCAAVHYNKGTPALTHPSCRHQWSCRVHLRHHLQALPHKADRPRR